MKAWVYDPHSGGNKIPVKLHETFVQLAHDFEKTRPWHTDVNLSLRFRGQFCYVGTQHINDEQIWPLGRLRFFDKDRWSVAIFLYSNERYEPDGMETFTFNTALGRCEPFIV